MYNVLYCVRVSLRTVKIFLAQHSKEKGSWVISISLWLWCRKGPGFWLLQESGLPLLLQSIAIIRLWNLPRLVAYFLCGHTVLYCRRYGTDFNSVADPDPLVKGTDQGPDPDPSIIKQIRILLLSSYYLRLTGLRHWKARQERKGGLSSRQR